MHLPYINVISIEMDNDGSLLPFWNRICILITGLSGRDTTELIHYLNLDNNPRGCIHYVVNIDGYMLVLYPTNNV